MITDPMPFRSLRALVASIQTHEEMLRLAPAESEERWRLHRTLAALGRQLDEAEKVWKAHHAKA
jgi:hypothetical protein